MKQKIENILFILILVFAAQLKLSPIAAFSDCKFNVDCNQDEFCSKGICIPYTKETHNRAETVSTKGGIGAKCTTTEDCSTCLLCVKDGKPTEFCDGSADCHCDLRSSDCPEVSKPCDSNDARKKCYQVGFLFEHKCNCKLPCDTPPLTCTEGGCDDIDKACAKGTNGCSCQNKCEIRDDGSGGKECSGTSDCTSDKDCFVREVNFGPSKSALPFYCRCLLKDCPGSKIVFSTGVFLCHGGGCSKKPDKLCLADKTKGTCECSPNICKRIDLGGSTSCAGRCPVSNEECKWMPFIGGERYCGCVKPTPTPTPAPDLGSP